jgi:hypothetical protein
MKYHAVFPVVLITLLATFSAYSDQPDPGTPEAVNDTQEMQKPAEAEAANDGQETQQPAEAAAANDDTETQQPTEAKTVGDKPQIQKPSEAEAMEAAIRYVNREGQMTIVKSEFIAWGTFNEKQVYWPIKLRLNYKTGESGTLRQNEYAVKISKNINGKWVGSPYWAWRTDFK